MIHPALRESRDLAVFEAVARLESFTAASAELRMSKQTVSDGVRRLEVAAGTRLLQRSTRRVLLTDAGQRMYPHCQDMVEAAKAAFGEVLGDEERPRGLLTVASTRTFGKLFLADVIFEFLEAYPEVRVDLRLGDRAFRIVEEGIDVSFQATAPGGKTLIVRTLGPATSCFVASPEFLKRSGRGRDGSPIRPEDMIEWRQRDGRDGISSRHARLIVASAEIAIAAAAKGLGITKAPDILARPFIASGELVPLQHEENHRSGSFVAVFPSRRGLSASVRVLVDMVARRFGEQEM